MDEREIANGDLELSLPETTLNDILSSNALDTEASQSYLTKLTTLPLPTLLEEPTLLQTQSHHLTSSLTSLTHTSYPTFLSLHHTTASLTSSLASLSDSLSTLLSSSLPALETTAAAWHDRTNDVLQERRKARVVLEQHDKLRDLLDIPILIDTCVRNGYFGEALSLAAHAKSLILHPSSPPILSSILAEVHHSINQMLRSLLQTLHEPHRRLPALWKAVNFLRKMDVLLEEEVALAFISAREGCLGSTLEASGRDVQRLVSAAQTDQTLPEREKEDLARYLKKYIDVWREGVYDIITQFTTIFLERSSSPSSLTLLSTYAMHALQTHLLPLLTSGLPHLAISALPTLLTQLTYCATAFTRVGMDFRGILSGLFAHTVANEIGSEMRAAGRRWVALVTAKTKEVPSQWLITPSLAAAPPTPAPQQQSSPPHIPPQIITSYPPLAEHTNALLTVLNGLRLLAPIAVRAELVGILDAVLGEGGEALIMYIKRLSPSPPVSPTSITTASPRPSVERSRTQNQTQTYTQEQEAQIARAAGEIYFSVFVPFMRRALGEGVYGVTSLGEEEIGGDLKRVMWEWEGWLG